ncbi:MAG: ABC transporter ATP-binding protein [Bacteroidales bacterium]
MREILQINRLTKKYGRITAVDDLSVTVLPGQVYGILGPNGSGKTTTLSVVMGVITAGSGTYSWFESENNTDSRKKIGSLIETPNFYPYLSLTDNLRIVAAVKGVPVQDIDRVLEIVGLSNRQNSSFITLSLGMKQRLAIASVLLGDPGVMVLDEPANGLDPEGIVQIRNIILAEREKGKTIIMASHILDEVEKLCTHAVILKDGKQLAEGPVDQLLQTRKYYKVACDKNELLAESLTRAGLIEDIKRENDYLDIYPAKNTDGSDINKFAFEQGIVLRHLELKKPTLENQFLELVKS